VFNPYYEVLFTNIGILKGAMGKHDEAISNFNKSIEYNHRSSHTPYYYYARYLKNQGKYVEAEEIINKGIAINPYNTDCLTLLAAILSETQQWDKLLATSQKILNIDPSSKDGKYI